MKYVEENSRIWDKRAENNDRWSTVVTAEEVAKAREGEWHIILTPEKSVPRDWFPAEMKGLKVLCLASGDGTGKYMLYEESHRILKAGGVLSILPVHLSNWRDRQGKKKTYTPKLIQAEIEEYGFSYAGTCFQKGVHWEKCHTLYYIKKGNITFDILEKVDVMNFVKK